MYTFFVAAAGRRRCPASSARLVTRSRRRRYFWPNEFASRMSIALMDMLAAGTDLSWRGRPDRGANERATAEMTQLSLLKLLPSFASSAQTEAAEAEFLYKTRAACLISISGSSLLSAAAD